jgi:uncharacterized membrane protein
MRDRTRHAISGLAHPLSTVGLVAGFVFFALSLTPSLMPRPFLVQGLLSGVSAACGYMIGTGLAWLWDYLELPSADRNVRRLPLIAGAGGVLLAMVFLWQAVGWQNSIRTLWDLPPLDSAEPYKLGLVALVAFLIALLLGRLFRLACLSLSRWLSRFVPRRVSNVIGALLAVALFWSIGQGVLIRSAVDAMDASFQQVDALMDDDTQAPTAPLKTGSDASYVAWGDIGQQGRNFIASGPGAAEIGGFWETSALEPVRVYVGLNNEETAERRAALALRELQRQGGFDRSVLVIVVPTGTEWVDPAAMDTLEYLHRGDVASVALQYSYLTSWLSLLVEPEEGQDAARALFDAVYGYWTSLPSQARPRLYLHGLSLGALNSQISTDIYDVVADPYQGALWSGPPFRSARWQAATAQRNEGSPAWLPRFRDGSIIRFTNQTNALNDAEADWGPIRFVFLQYASDPVTFFDPTAVFREPDWMQAPRGPDVSPDLTWLPVVTMLQLLFDMMIATSSPMGHGHVYAPEHYIDAWVAVTEPPVGPAEISRLRTMVMEASDRAQ